VGRAAGDGEGAPPPRDLDAIAALASERERAAMQAEREIAAFYAALFMHDKVGERFQGVVASVVEFGLFVELEPFFVEGLVKATDLGAGFRLDKRMHALVEPRSGRAFRIGDRLEVEVIAASPIRRQIDLALVEAGEVVRAPRPLGRGGEEAPGFAPREAFALREPGAGGPRRGGRPAARAEGRGDARSGRAVAAKAAGKKGRGGAPGRRGTKRRRR
jgi:ribonuclease R